MRYKLVYHSLKLIKVMHAFIAYIMDGSISFTVYWALSIKLSTFFTQTRFHVPVKHQAKHTPSSSLGHNHSHQYHSKATSSPKCQPCTVENLPTCLFFHLKQTAKVLCLCSKHTRHRLSAAAAKHTLWTFYCALGETAHSDQSINIQDVSILWKAI